MTSNRFLCGLFVVVSVCSHFCVEAEEAIITVDLSTTDPLTSFVYDGHGGLSAGASSRLLVDYDPSYRSDILDLLFKPQFGAATHLLKIEIGSDVQSTDGTEPSYQHTRGVVNCNAGYESWLMSEAKARNPAIKTYALSWGVPAWVGDGSYFSQDNIEYQVGYLKCLKNVTGFNTDYLGIWNERQAGPVSYTVGLRKALDAAGFQSTKIVLPDGHLGGDNAHVVPDMEANSTYRDAIYGIGLHYPCVHPDNEITQLGKAFWSSEDYSTVGNWAGAGCWGRSLNQNFVRNNMTSTIAWSLIWAVYPELPYGFNGLMYSQQPWSGHYSVQAPIWTSAHTMQFTTPGWVYVSDACRLLPGAGSVVVLVSSTTDASPDVTVVAEKLEGDCLRCKGGPTTAEDVTVQLANGLAADRPFFVWSTNETHPFVYLGTQQPKNGVLTFHLARDTIVTLSTLNGTHGVPARPIPSPSPFPYPYSDDFDGYTPHSLARFFADEGGSFEVQTTSTDETGDGSGSANQVLVQVGQRCNANSWGSCITPYTFLGDVNWTDVSVSVDMKLSADSGSGSVDDGSVGGGGTPLSFGPCDADVAQQRWVVGSPAPGYVSNGPTDLCLNVDGCGSGVVLYECVTSGGTCAGPNNYTNLQWELTSTGQIVSDFDGLCVTLESSTSVVMSPCQSPVPASQFFNYDSSTGLVSTKALGGQVQCLSAGQTYAGVCGRVSAPPTRSLGSTSGECLVVTGAGVWQYRVGDAVVVQGQVDPFVPSEWHTLSLDFTGSTVTGSVDGHAVFTNSSASTNGYVALRSSYTTVMFDNFKLG